MSTFVIREHIHNADIGPVVCKKGEVVRFEPAKYRIDMDPPAADVDTELEQEFRDSITNLGWGAKDAALRQWYSDEHKRGVDWPRIIAGQPGDAESRREQWFELKASYMNGHMVGREEA